MLNNNAFSTFFYKEIRKLKDIFARISLLQRYKIIEYDLLHNFSYLLQYSHISDH